MWAPTIIKTLPVPSEDKGERLDNDPSGARYGCFLPDLTGLARRLPAPTSRMRRIGAGQAGFKTRVLWRTTKGLPERRLRNQTAI